MPANLTIKNEYASVIVSPDAGASLRSFSVNEDGASYELLAGGENEHGPTLVPHGTGSFIMAPWVNRIRGGRLVAPDGVHELRLDAPLHATHGLVRLSAWNVTATTESTARLEIELPESWPYRGRIEYSVALEDRSFVQTLRLLAAPDEARSFPGGVGWHPWFKRSLGSAGHGPDSGEMSVRADVVSEWGLDDTMTALGTRSDSATTRRLRQGTRFEPGEVDGCFLIEPGGRAVLAWPELTLTMSGSETVTHLMFYSPGHAICVEPQTSTVDAAQLAARGISDTGHVLVDRSNPLTATTSWGWEL